jgi:hypothetical protein
VGEIKRPLYLLPETTCCNGEHASEQSFNAKLVTGFATLLLLLADIEVWKLGPLAHLVGARNRRPRKLFSAEAQADPGANQQIILAIVETVGDIGRKVLRLYGANRDVLRHLEINAAARRHGKIIFGPC